MKTIYILSFENGTYDDYQKDIMSVTDSPYIRDWWLSHNTHRSQLFVCEEFTLNGSLDPNEFPTIRGYKRIVDEYNAAVQKLDSKT